MKATVVYVNMAGKRRRFTFRNPTKSTDNIEKELINETIRQNDSGLVEVRGRAKLKRPHDDSMSVFIVREGYDKWVFL